MENLGYISVKSLAISLEKKFYIKLKFFHLVKNISGSQVFIRFGIVIV